MLVLHPYVPGLRQADQQKCWEALGEVSSMNGAEVLSWQCVQDYDYAEGLERWWETNRVMVLVEHDIAPTLDQLVEMANCPREFCSMDYAGPGWPSWAVNPDAACIGLAKFRGVLRVRSNRRPFVPRVHWHDVGGALVQVLGKPHIHSGPVAHYHS